MYNRGMMIEQLTRAYLTTREAAVVFGVSERTIRTWLRAGKIQGRKIDRRWFVLKSEVLPPKEPPS